MKIMYPGKTSGDSASHGHRVPLRALRCGLALAVVMLWAALPVRIASAHHSFAMYDTNKTVLIRGTVKEFQWTNPHALLWILGTTDGGIDDLWTIELPTSPGNLTRMGWTKHSLATGDALTVEINPLRDGSHGGSFKKATLANTGIVLVATAKDDPYGGDAGADLPAAAHAESGKLACSASPGGAPSVVWLQTVVGCALAWAARARRRGR